MAGQGEKDERQSMWTRGKGGRSHLRRTWDWESDHRKTGRSGSHGCGSRYR